jgi:predicted Zn-dependent protease
MALASPAVLALLLFAGCDSPTVVRPAFAYDPTELTGGLLYRWSTGARVRVFVEPASGTPLSVAAAVLRATQAWNALPQVREFTLEIATTREAADIIVYERSQTQPVLNGGCAFAPSGAIGYTYFCPAGGRAERLRVVGSPNATVSVVIRVDMAATASQTALDALVAHEMGHAIGIGGHSPQAADVMSPRPVATTPTDRDAQTLRNLLGRAADVTL